MTSCEREHAQVEQLFTWGGAVAGGLAAWILTRALWRRLDFGTISVLSVLFGWVWLMALGASWGAILAVSLPEAPLRLVKLTLIYLAVAGCWVLFWIPGLLATRYFNRYFEQLHDSWWGWIICLALPHPSRLEREQRWPFAISSGFWLIVVGLGLLAWHL